MWNTKLLARGRRVNREFAFISFSNPAAAARALAALHGSRAPGLEKDSRGITVEYESGEHVQGGAGGTCQLDRLPLPMSSCVPACMCHHRHPSGVVTRGAAVCACCLRRVWGQCWA
jgi:hypothetical protein